MTQPWWRAPAAAPDEAAREAARARQAELTKPPGSLGRLEAIAIRLAALQGTAAPRLDRLHMTVFAADHGIVAEAISAFPQAVTLEMVRNFVRGGAAISVLARELGAALEVVDVGTATDPGAQPGVIRARAGPGTANFCVAPAMDERQLEQALGAGRSAVARAVDQRAQLLVCGEMGIGNTTAATAVACVLLEASPDEVVGPGTGLDAQGVARKAAVIERALALHGRPNAPLEALRVLGGFEIVALAGAYLAAARHGLPVLVDGFIASVAALVAVREVPSAAAWLLHAHRSAEPGHARLLQALEADPVVDLGMRLGEGSGAAVAVPVLRAACALHAGMATFAEAAVSRSGGPVP
jgi:nicotinate-nucleotide--dimethylbenzimidazole phosphoribosyltransferase